MDTFSGSLDQWCCGEGGTLQTNVSGVRGERSQCLSRTGFAPAHGVCAFPVFTAQAPGCSAGNCLRRALACMHFRLSGAPQRCRLDRACVLCPSQVQAAQETRCLASTVTPRCGVRLIASPVPAAQFSGCTTGAPSQECCLSLLGS